MTGTAGYGLSMAERVIRGVAAILMGGAFIVFAGPFTAFWKWIMGATFGERWVDEREDGIRMGYRLGGVCGVLFGLFIIVHG
jgi:hypothetical protein